MVNKEQIANLVISAILLQFITQLQPDTQLAPFTNMDLF